VAQSDIDDQIAVCKESGLDPFSGDLFIFKDVEATRIGILAYDGHGFHWCIKRFSTGTVAWWPSEDKVMQLLPQELEIMLWGGNPRDLNLPPMWRPLHSRADQPSKE
jgi:hypothetical protein